MTRPKRLSWLEIALFVCAWDAAKLSLALLPAMAALTLGQPHPIAWVGALVVLTFDPLDRWEKRSWRVAKSTHGGFPI